MNEAVHKQSTHRKAQLPNQSPVSPPIFDCRKFPTTAREQLESVCFEERSDKFTAVGNLSGETGHGTYVSANHKKVNIVSLLVINLRAYFNYHLISGYSTVPYAGSPG